LIFNMKKFLSKSEEYQLMWESYISPEDAYNDENNIISYDDLAEIVATDSLLLRKMGQRGLTEMDLHQNSDKFLRFILGLKNQIFSRYVSLNSSTTPNPDNLRLADDEIIKSDWAEAKQDNDEPDGW